MSDDAALPNDPLHLNLKSDAAHVRRENVNGVMVFEVANENVYPKQAAEIEDVVRAALLTGKTPKALVDLTRVQFIASDFIGRLIDLHKLAGERDGALKICVTGERVAYTMKLVKLNKLIEIGGDRQQLLESF